MTDHPEGVRIAQAAALYGLAPSALRWWEKQGVLRPPRRHGGQRFYRDEDLRRIGLVYLCCVTSMMPLDTAALVASGTAGADTWRRAIHEHVDHLDQQIARITAARAYLDHLLRCTDDDPALCPHLDGELRTRTPRGRARPADLVAAARTSLGGVPRNSGPEPGDETAGRGRRRDENDGADKPVKGRLACASCGHSITRLPGRGRLRVYCRAGCRQRAYRARQALGRGGDSRSDTQLPLS